LSIVFAGSARIICVDLFLEMIDLGGSEVMTFLERYVVLRH
jgi:hypothetical protein